MASPTSGSPRKPRSGAGAPTRASAGQGGNRSGGQRRPAPKPEIVDDNPATKLAGPLAKVLTRLPEIERRVVELRMGLTDGHPADLADTARALGLTPHETKLIEQRAFSRIREVVPLEHLQKFLST